MLNFINNISPTEWIVIAVILILLFGSRMAREIGKTGGQTLKEVKKIKKTFIEAVEDDEEDDDKPQKSAKASK